MKIHTFFFKNKLTNSKKSIASITTFTLILTIALSLFIGTMYFTDSLKEKTLVSNKKLEVLNSIQTFRSDLLNIISKNNTNLNYSNSFDLESIQIKLKNKTISGIDSSLKSTKVEIKISSLGLVFCSNYSFYPIDNSNFYYNGSCILKS